MPLFTGVRGETVWKIVEGLSRALHRRLEAVDRVPWTPLGRLLYPEFGVHPDFPNSFGRVIPRSSPNRYPEQLAVASSVGPVGATVRRTLRGLRDLDPFRARKRCAVRRMLRGRVSPIVAARPGGPLCADRVLSRVSSLTAAPPSCCSSLGAAFALPRSWPHRDGKMWLSA